MNPKKAKNTILSAVVATSAMTVCSYLASVLKKENLEPPVLLSAMYKEQISNNAKANIMGWATHYGLGISWAALMEIAFSASAIPKTISSGLISGTLSGLTGVAIWKALFSLHPQSQKTDINAFYKHLIVAHIAFMTTYLMLSKDRNLMRKAVR